MWNIQKRALLYLSKDGHNSLLQGNNDGRYVSLFREKNFHEAFCSEPVAFESPFISRRVGSLKDWTYLRELQGTEDGDNSMF